MDSVALIGIAVLDGLILEEFHCVLFLFLLGVFDTTQSQGKHLVNGDKVITHVGPMSTCIRAWVKVSI